MLSTVPEANFCSFEWTSFKFKEFHNCMQFTTLRFYFPSGLVNYMSHTGTSDGFEIRRSEPYSLGPVNLRHKKVHILKFIPQLNNRRGCNFRTLMTKYNDGIIVPKWMILTRLSLSATHHYCISSIDGALIVTSPNSIGPYLQFKLRQSVVLKIFQKLWFTNTCRNTNVVQGCIEILVSHLSLSLERSHSAHSKRTD